MDRAPTGTVAFMFTEIEDSIALWERAPSTMATAVERHDVLINAAIANNGGHVFATLGNGVASAFSRCDAAATAAIELHAAIADEPWPTETPITVRVGLHVGEAFERDGDYFGPAVNTTARIASAASGGQTIASNLFASLIGSVDELAATSVGVHRLRGIVEPLSMVHIHRAGSSAPTSHVRSEATEPAGTSWRALDPQHDLLQRENVLQSLTDALDELRLDGPGRVVTLAAEAGGGKTTLVDELMRRCAVTDTAAVIGACDPIDNPRPYGPWRDIALDPTSELSGIGFATDPRIDVLDGVLLRLRSRKTPVVLVVEDLHWIDDASLEVLVFLTRRIADLSLMLVLTYRPEETAERDDLTKLIGEAARLPGTIRPSLEPLTVASVERMIAGTGLDPSVVHKMTDGNPFFVSEVAATGELLPGSVRDAIVARVARLDPEAVEMLGVVALAPRAMPFEVLLAVMDVSARQVDRAVAAGLLVIDGTNLRFRHDLARTAVLEDQSPMRAVETHRALARILAGRQNPDHGVIAHHAIGSHDAELILEYLPIAAEDAYRAGAFREALPLLRIAIDHADRTNANSRTDLRLSYARQTHLLDNLDEALRMVDDAVRIARSTGDAHTISRALLTQALRRTSAPDPEGAEASLEEAIAVLADQPPSTELVEALHGSTMLHMLHRRHDRALREAERTHATALQVGDETRITIADNLRGIVSLATGDADEGVALLRSRADQAAAAEDLHQLSHLLGMLGTGAGERRRYEPANAALLEAIDLQDSYDLAAESLYNKAWLARVRFEQGRWREAIDIGSTVLGAVATGSGSTAVTATGAVGRSLVRQGDPTGIDLLAPVRHASPNHFVQYVWSPVSGIAEWYWLTGSSDRIEQTIAPLYGRALDSDSEWAIGELAFWMWRAGVLDRPPPGAAEPFASHISGDWERSAAAWDQLGCPYEAAIARLDGPADAQLMALEAFGRLGAKPAADLARARLRKAGVRPPRGPTEATRSNPVGLTKRQRDVLALIVDGCENAEIAERLFVSKKTVEHHVSAVFAKLGVDSRRAAVAEAARVGALET